MLLEDGEETLTNTTDLETKFTMKAGYCPQSYALANLKIKVTINITSSKLFILHLNDSTEDFLKNMGIPIKINSSL